MLVLLAVSMGLDPSAGSTPYFLPLGCMMPQSVVHCLHQSKVRPKSRELKDGGPVGITLHLCANLCFQATHALAVALHT